MRFEVNTDYLAPIQLGPYEHVTIWLPDGREVGVYSDAIYVRTPEDRGSHKDGKKIWRALKAPYGKTAEV